MIPPVPPARAAVLVALAVAGVVLQLSVLPAFGLTGVVPDVALVVVVAVALHDDTGVGLLTAFGTGLLLDLAPPADHTVGRWALSFVVVAYLAGLVRQDAERSAAAAAAVVASAAFIATSVFALSGLLLRDPGVTVAATLTVLPLAVLYDVLLGLAVVPLVRSLLRRLDAVPARW